MNKTNRETAELPSELVEKLHRTSQPNALESLALLMPYVTTQKKNLTDMHKKSNTPKETAVMILTWLCSAPPVESRPTCSPDSQPV